MNVTPNLGDVPPALTPEEWQRLQVGDRLNGTMIWATGGKFGMRPMGLPELNDSRHAIAALALHGQDYGFTREHLRILNQAIVALFPQASFLKDDLGEIRARIAALLPPDSAAQTWAPVRRVRKQKPTDAAAP